MGEELAISLREHPDVHPDILKLAIEMARERGGATMPVSDYDIRFARDQIAGEENEIARLQRDRDYAVRWANQSVKMLQDAFFPLADALRGLEGYLRDTPHHNALEAAAARKALATFDNAEHSPSPIAAQETVE